MPAFVPPVGAIIVRRQKQIVTAFRAAGATDQARATTTSALGLREGMAFRILRRHSILREAGDARLYLDEPVWEALRIRRRKLALGIVGTMLLVMTAAVLWAVFH